MFLTAYSTALTLIDIAAVSTRPSSVTVAVGLDSSMDTTISIDASFNARVVDLRDRACRQLNCGANSRYQLWKYNRAFRCKGEQLCGSAIDIHLAARGMQTLWCVRLKVQAFVTSA